MVLIICPLGDMRPTIDVRKTSAPIGATNRDQTVTQCFRIYYLIVEFGSPVVRSLPFFQPVKGSSDTLLPFRARPQSTAAPAGCNPHVSYKFGGNSATSHYKFGGCTSQSTDSRESDLSSSCVLSSYSDLVSSTRRAYQISISK